MKPSEAISKLLNTGWTEAKIARSVGVSQATINRIKHGAQPGFAAGMALVQLATSLRQAEEAV